MTGTFIDRALDHLLATPDADVIIEADTHATAVMYWRELRHRTAERHVDHVRYSDGLLTLKRGAGRIRVIVWSAEGRRGERPTLRLP